jgi:hypothetical protein
VVSLVPAACDDSKEAAVDTASLTRAAASLALSVGELVERYAAEPPTGDWREVRQRLVSILTDEAGTLDFFGAVRERFSAAASASREAGNNKGQTARQLVAAVWLASDAFRPPLPDYRPGDQSMLAEIASSLEPQLNAALTSSYNFETGGRELPADLGSILPDAFAYVLVIASYNCTDQNGSHPIRDLMRTHGERDPPAEFIDPAGNLRLPQGSEPDEQISQFEEWLSPSNGRLNQLWYAATEAVRSTGLPRVFKPAVEKALE